MLEIDDPSRRLRHWADAQAVKAPSHEELHWALRQLRRRLLPRPLEAAEAASLARFPRQLHRLGLARGAVRLGALPADLWEQARGLQPSSVGAELRRSFAAGRGRLLGLLPKQPPREPGNASGRAGAGK